MKRRVRAIAFGCAALVCAGLAAAMTGGYRQDIQSELGPLRPVVVATARLPADHPITAKDVGDLLEVRRIPERFAPAGALALPEEAAGRAPATVIPAGSYVLAGQLREPGRGDPRHDRATRVGPGRTPVEISVMGAEALGAGGGDPVGSRVDVIVTSEPGPGGGHGRTYVAARGVRLLALSQSGEGESSNYSPTNASAWTATLALSRAQALHLIQAESFARSVRLIAS
jgi:Flp pilus assembly protein CpaB